MKISVEDGVVVCSLEDKNKSFMARAWDCFDGFYNGKLRIHLYIRPEDSQTARIKEEIRMMNRISVYADRFGVDLDSTFLERKELLKTFAEADRLKRLEEQREQARHDKWDKLCAKGCGDCKYLINCGDDHYCRAGGDLLDEKNMPAVINGVHYMFNWQAFPSKNCLYKI